MQMLRGLGLDQRFYFIVVRTWEHWDLDKDCPALVVSLPNMVNCQAILIRESRAVPGQFERIGAYCGSVNDGTKKGSYRFLLNIAEKTVVIA